MSKKIQIKRGLKVDLPTLSIGEFGLCTDTRELFVGTTNGNLLINGVVPVETITQIQSNTQEIDNAKGNFPTLSDRLDNMIGEGGGTPSNVILFENWTWGESVTIGSPQNPNPNPPDETSPPTEEDTTAPILTITAGGTFTGIKSVTMTTNEISTIYYTLNNSTPTESSQVYSSPLSISATTTLKAFAKDTAGNTSAIQTITYTLADPTAPLENPTNLSVVSNTTGTSLTLTWTASTSLNVAGYDVLRDGTRVSTASGTTQNITGLVKDTEYTFTVKTKDASGKLSSGVSITVRATDTIAPTLTMTDESIFADTQVVTMTANEASTIYYTLDGSTPTETSDVYSNAITLNDTTTVKAFAIDTSGNKGKIYTHVFTKLAESGATKIFSDSFDRANSEVGLGYADSEHEWKPFIASNGTTIHGIKDSQFYYVGGTDTRNNAGRRMSYITLPTNNFEIEAVLSQDSSLNGSTTVGVNIGIRINPSTSTNMLYLQYDYFSASSRYIIRKIGSSASTVATGTVMPKAGDTLRIVHHSSGLIEVYVNGVIDISHTETEFLRDRISVGLGADTSAPYLDSFEVSTIGGV